MCGIMGYVGERQAAPIVLEGLARLEYRGYDSAGLAILQPTSEFATRKSVGNLASLRAELNGDLPGGCLGIGHTRWATPGPPSVSNAQAPTGTATVASRSSKMGSSTTTPP